MSACPKCLRGGTGPHPPSCTPTDRFWNKVERGDGCWLWTGSSGGWYGEIRESGRKVSTHRFSWELHNGPIPDGMYVCHRCDTGLCVRPDHLFLGTQRENIADMDRKGRRVAPPRLEYNTPGPCSNCGTDTTDRRMGQCGACRAHLYRYGKQRTARRPYERSR